MTGELVGVVAALDYDAGVSRRVGTALSAADRADTRRSQQVGAGQRLAWVCE